MKKVLSLILALALVFAVASFTAEAKVFHQFHCCGGDGIYTCDAKDCKGGRITCGRCNGTGQTTEKCADCGGTGKCRVCNGSGKRVGDNTIACDNCKGTGKCQGGPGWGPCTNGYYYNKCPDCGGEKVVWHNSEWCKYAREHGGKCPICKGTGYEGDGVEGTPNDGVSNVPHAGDGIYYLDGSYAVYGGGSSGGNSSGGNSSGGGPSKTDPSDNDTAQKDNDTGENTKLLPEDKHTTIYLGTSSVDNGDFSGKTAIGIVRYQEMTDDQKAVYDGLSDEELNSLLVNVSDIIATAEVGKISKGSQGSVDAFCRANGINNLSDANLLPLSFDGHIEIGFPILVSVEVNPDFFDGSKPMHIFHIKEDGSIFQIPDESINWQTRQEDDRIVRIEFFTESFSDFLLSDAEGLVVTTDIETSSDKGPTVTNDDTKTSDRTIIFIIVGVFVLTAAAATTVFVLKKRKKLYSIDEMQGSEGSQGKPRDK
ncbi:MAG: hypothetical protein J5766_02955 [Clostridia bacterium]|nr:hypothetical protein [Clostridia bacterium]